MNNPNPFVPQGSLLDQKNRKRARVKVAVYSIFAFNILLITPLLIQGCKKEPAPDTAQLNTPTQDTNTPDTNQPPQLPAAGTNTLATQSNTPPPTPPAPEPPPAPPAPTSSEYVVAKGDSFYSIGKKNGVSIKAIEAANPGVNPAKLKVGQKLQIPAGSATGSSAPGATTDGSETVYVVKSGDSLTKIAKANGVSVKSIRAANSLKTDKITVGEKLKIPAKAAPAEAAPAPVAPPATTPVMNNAAPSAAPTR